MTYRNSRTVIYLRSFGIDADLVSEHGFDEDGYYEIQTDDETGLRLYTPDGLVRVRREWPEGFEYQRFMIFYLHDSLDHLRGR